jgi:putative transposase
MADDRMAVLETVRKAIAEGDPEFLREGVRVLAQAVTEAEVRELTGLPRGERDPERRLTSRNGYRERRWDTRVGTVNLAIPRVRDGSYFPSLLEPRRRAEPALLAVVQEAYPCPRRARHHQGRSGRSAGPASAGRASRSWATSRSPDSKPSRAADM